MTVMLPVTGKASFLFAPDLAAQGTDLLRSILGIDFEPRGCKQVFAALAARQRAGILHVGDATVAKHACFWSAFIHFPQIIVITKVGFAARTTGKKGCACKAVAIKIEFALAVKALNLVLCLFKGTGLDLNTHGQGFANQEWIFGPIFFLWKHLRQGAAL